MATTRRTTDLGDTTTRTQTSTTTRRGDDDRVGDGGPREVADTVMGAAGEAVARIPDAAATTRQTLTEATRTIQAGSDESLSAGTLLSVGFALGLLVGGANRLLVLLALVPAAAMGLTLLDRQNALRRTNLGR